MPAEQHLLIPPHKAATCFCVTQYIRHATQYGLETRPGGLREITGTKLLYITHNFTAPSSQAGKTKNKTNMPRENSDSSCLKTMPVHCSYMAFGIGTSEITDKKSVQKRCPIIKWCRCLYNGVQNLKLNQKCHLRTRRWEVWNFEGWDHFSLTYITFDGWRVICLRASNNFSADFLLLVY